jgi:hypothetical protein
MLAYVPGRRLVEKLIPTNEDGDTRPTEHDQ